MNTTSETKHTPGPWNWADGHARTWGVYAVHAAPGMITRSPEPICEIPRPDNDGLGLPEAEANARLIASAPKLAADNAALLAALRAVVAALEQPVQYSGLRMAESSDILRADAAAAANIARAAIERAEKGGAE